MNFNEKTVLVVEDEPSLATVLCEYLSHAGFKTEVLDNGSSVIPSVKTNQPDLIVLDLMLPEKDGLTIFRELRTFTSVPVIMATAKVDEIDRLLGLELGADDYVCKPYSPRELVARVKNILRRSEETSEYAKNEGPLVINEASMSVVLMGKSLVLTPAEFRLLNHLFQHMGQIFSRDQLMQKIYDDNRVVTDRTIDSHIKNLRKKFHEVSPDCDYIKSIYSVGYRLEI
ncbi:response regulator [Reinekea marinisedimentorum]|uniref:Two-component system response regulator BaeR n=1 Tax=Reinekea marinisedimentorum TaxID=230495 RepID=A0A4R3I4K6_9GAMM|nr:response regulator [Reinekea marinisedimentorum]TCS38909.1 two-component system response regulator BaeR [Reinekea marinisedimentorum]